MKEGRQASWGGRGPGHPSRHVTTDCQPVKPEIQDEVVVVAVFLVQAGLLPVSPGPLLQDHHSCSRVPFYKSPPPS